MTLQEFQKNNPTKEDKEEATRHMSDEEIDGLIAQAGIVQAKIAYSRLKKRNQISRYNKKYNDLTTRVLNYFLSSDPGNIVFSPFSVLMLLSIAADAVNGNTRQEILNVIGSDLEYESHRNMISEIQRLFTEIVTIVDGKESYTKGGEVVSANAVCVREDIKNTINAKFEKTIEKYHGELFSSKNIVDEVNNWVKEKTKGMIVKAADESMNQMVLCLMNAIAFEAEWAEIYEEDDVYEDDFTDADGNTHEVQMMNSTEYSYIENDLFTGFVKPYKDFEFSYMALLPKKKGKKAINKAVEAINLTEVFHSAESRKVYVTMPEFKYDFDRDLKDVCRKMGIETMFTPQADFSPMSQEWLMMDAIIHKAYIEVDRKGTKAAAVSMGIVVCGCAPQPEEFKEVRLDRPFIYAIMHNQTGLPVFAGVTNYIESE